MEERENADESPAPLSSFSLYGGNIEENRWSKL
jgi:hypothetical protein